MAKMGDRWLSVDEIGKDIGISRAPVYRWIDKHILPTHRMGNLWRFKEGKVDMGVRVGRAAGRNEKASVR